MVERKTLAEGRHLGLYEENRWEFAARPGISGVVGTLPVTAAGDLILVEQFRPPVSGREANDILIDFKIMACLWLAEARGLI